MIHSRLRFGTYYPVQTVSHTKSREVSRYTPLGSMVLSNALNKKEPYIHGPKSSSFEAETVERVGPIGEQARDLFKRLDPDYRADEQAFPVGGGYEYNNLSGQHEREEVGIITGKAAAKLMVIETFLETLKKSAISDHDSDFTMLKAVLEGSKKSIINVERTRNPYPNAKQAFEVSYGTVPGKKKGSWTEVLTEVWPAARP